MHLSNKTYVHSLKMESMLYAFQQDNVKEIKFGRSNEPKILGKTLVFRFDSVEKQEDLGTQRLCSPLN